MSGNCSVIENKSPISQILSILKVPSKIQLKQIPSEKKQNPKFHYYTGRVNVIAAGIKIFKANFLANLEIFQWRKQTEFPIVKTFFIKISENHKKQYELIDLEVFYEVCPLRLTEIQDVPLSQSLYLTKQALIGFQRLYEKFGGFQIRSSMIAVNEGGKCKVWINEDFSSNNISKLSISETKMLNQIISTIQAHTQQTKTSIKIFNSLRNCNTFLTAIKSIQFLITSYKILVPCRFIKLYEKNQMVKNLSDNQSDNIRLSIPVNFSKKIRNFASPCSYYTRINSGRDMGISALVTPHRSRSPRLIRKLKTQPDQNRQRLKKFKSSNQTTEASTPASQMSFCFEGLQSEFKKNTTLLKFGNVKKIESIISINSEGQSDITFGKSPQATIKEQTSIYQTQQIAVQTKNIQQIKDSIFSQKFKFFNCMRKKPYYTEFQEVLGDNQFRKQRGNSYQKKIIKRNQWSQSILDLNSHKKINESIELKEQATLRLERMNKNPLQMSILSGQFQEQH